jgi:2-iminobutanoate/2-iminopropanoate deaminase
MSDNRSWQPVHLPDEYPAPAGAYSPGVRAGNLLFVSGQIPKNPRSGQVEAEGIVAQSRQTLDNVRMVLEAGGATLDDVVSVTVYLEDEKDWGAFNEVYKSVFRPPYPARAVVGARLRGILVEISAIAVVRDGVRPGR